MINNKWAFVRVGDELITSDGIHVIVEKIIPVGNVFRVIDDNGIKNLLYFRDDFKIIYRNKGLKFLLEQCK